LLPLKRKAILFGALLALCTPLTIWGDDVPGSRLYWLLNPNDYIEQNQSEKASLEACVSRLGFVDYVRILPNSGSNLIEIDIRNVANFAITGLLVQPVDDRLERLDLDGRVLINFEAIPPGSSATYSEEIDGVFDEFPEETSVEVIAWDVVNADGEQMVRHIFWSQWPTISSEEELEYARQELCDE